MIRSWGFTAPATCDSSLDISPTVCTDELGLLTSSGVSRSGFTNHGIVPDCHAWTIGASNPGPTGYEPVALTN